MDSSGSNGVQRVRIEFRAEQSVDSSAWRRAGLAALEQAEAEIERDGMSITLEQAATDGGDGSRGFIDSVVVSIVSDALTTLLFHAASDLIVRWQKMRRNAPQISQALEGSGSGQEFQVILHAGNNQTAIPFETPDDQIYQQLALWTPQVLEAGQVTFEVVRKSQ